MLVLLSFLTFPIVCIAQVIPTLPGPGQTFTAGSECTIKWKPDTTGTWDSFDIDLMSGSNNNMTLVINVVSELDGASSSSYSWTCPNVDPYAAIYFYQFNQNNAPTNTSHAWTTRFTIESEDGMTTPPEHSMQPDGDPIPWGSGKLSFAHVEHSKTHSGTAHFPFNTPATAEQVSSTSEHSRTPKTETMTPEVTLNVPTPKPTRHSRRNGFMTVYGSGAHIDNLFCRTASTNSDCKARLRSKPRRL